MSRDGKRRSGLTYEDRVLWTTVAKSIKPLAASSRNAPEENAEIEAESSKPALKPPPKFSKPAPIAKNVVPPLSKPSVPQPTALGRRMKQRVARGKEKIDARLDLHGYTQDEAHSALLRFLRSANDRDVRLVLVITGKGRGGEIGVLRRQVPQWLALPEFRALVVGFEDAAINHGGEGALYVRVKRARG
jgi:DNA-nicking Smr family endonuclease